MEAQHALVSWRDNRQKQANIKVMVARITSFTKEKGIYDQRDAFCLRQFGEKHLNAMGSEQLRQVLVFVEDYQDLPKIASVAETTMGTPQSHWAAYKALLIQYPMPFAFTGSMAYLIGKLF
ncbi:hypothetical protein D9M68_768280 [compost metagenome]